MLSLNLIVPSKSKDWGFEITVDHQSFDSHRYFEADDLDDAASSKGKSSKTRPVEDDLDYIPAPGSPSYEASKNASKKDDDEDDDDEDPLEQFMKANNNQAKKDLEAVGKKKEKKEDKWARMRNESTLASPVNSAAGAFAMTSTKKMIKNPTSAGWRRIPMLAYRSPMKTKMIESCNTTMMVRRNHLFALWWYNRLFN